MIAHFMKVIFTFLDEDSYFVLTGEWDVHIDHRNKLANDVVTYAVPEQANWRKDGNYYIGNHPLKVGYRSEHYDYAF